MKQPNQKQISILHLIFRCLTDFFSRFKKGIMTKIHMLCFLIMNSILLNLLCVSILKITLNKSVEDMDCFHITSAC